MERPYSLWDADCGIGKSRAALMVVQQMQSRMTLIITLKRPMTSVWPEQIAQTLDGVWVKVLDKGTSRDKDREMLGFDESCSLNERAGIVIVNYETARLLTINAVQWELVIADESHKLAAHNSKQSKELAILCNRIPKKIAMTGTAWANRPLMVYGQVRWFEPERRGAHVASKTFGGWGAFFDTYAEYYVKDDIKIPTGWKNLDLLADKLKPYVIQVRKEDVLTLPQRFEIVRKATLTPSHRKAYNELRDSMVTYIDGKMTLAQNVLVLATRLHQLTGGFYRPFNSQETLPVPQADAKIEEMADILDEIGGHPVVIFTCFDADVRRIQNALDKMGLTHSELTGTKDTHIGWKNGDTQVLVANISAGGTGIDLTRASYVIYYSIGHSRVEYEQSMDRVHRPGQDQTVFIYYVVAQDTIDEDILAALKSKGEISQELKERIRGKTAEH